MVALLTSSPLTVAWSWAAFPLINVKVNKSPWMAPSSGPPSTCWKPQPAPTLVSCPAVTH